MEFNIINDSDTKIELFGFKSDGYKSCPANSRNMRCYTDSAGGAIENFGQIEKLIKIDFKNNSAVTGNTNKAYGGAIYNEGTICDLSNVTFSGNYVQGEYAFGGAIDNEDDATIGNLSNVTFSGNYTLGELALGGAIENLGTIGNLDNIIFSNNYALAERFQAEGGAISSIGTIGDLSNVIFSNNYAQGSLFAEGGAIYNNGTIGNLDNVTFNNNYIQGGNFAFGGAIYNEYYGTIGDLSNATFSGNYIQGNQANGGVIYNYGTIGDLDNIIFSNNYAWGGPYAASGAIYNEGTIGNLSNVTFSGNYAQGNQADAGAIDNNNGKIGDLDNIEFIGNYAVGNYAYGAAIINGGTIGDLSNVTFSNNYAQGSYDTGGGAIYNYDTIGNLSNVTFSGNYVQGEYAYGGAIVNTSIIGNLDNVTFTGNYAQGTVAVGGAIYNNGTITITSINGESKFSGNYTKTIIDENNSIIKSSAITNMGYNEYDNSSGDKTSYNSILNLNAGNYKIVINDEINGWKPENTSDYTYKNENNNIININKNDIDISAEQDGSRIAPSHGVIELNNKISDHQVNLYNGTMKLGSYTYGENNPEILRGMRGVGEIASGNEFNIYGGHLTMIDNSTDNHHLGILSLNNDITMSLDANLEDKTMDTVSFDEFKNPNNSMIDVNKINIIKPTSDTAFEIPLVDSSVNAEEKLKFTRSVKYSGGEIVYSPIYKYDIKYDELTGNFKFNTTYTPQSKPQNKFNPAILSPMAAVQAGALATTAATINEAFYAMDAYMVYDLHERVTMRDRNKYALNMRQGMLHDDAISRRNNREAWFRPYVTFENVPLKNGPKVDNVAYGSYFGTNTKIKELGHGWDGAMGVFIGYNGAKQKYSGIDVYQNGATLGVVGEAYKKNFFSGLALSVSPSMGSAHTMYGRDDFTMLSAGIASKSGYNFELKDGKYIIQPTILLGYSFTNTFDYTTASNVKMKSEPLHNLQIEPGIRFIANLKNDWRPYVGVSMVWNLLNKTDFTANDVQLPKSSIKPYVRYGLGVQKTWSERLSSFLQAFVTNGGRNGVGLQGGITWNF